MSGCILFVGMARSGDDPKATAQVAMAVVAAEPVTIFEYVRDAVNAFAATVAVSNPEAGAAVQVLAILGGWFYNPRKYDRVAPALTAIAQRLEEIGSDYVKKEEFADLMEDALKRISEQPDSERRQRLQEILLRVMEQPSEHVEHRLFLRLADELPSAALRVLFATRSVASARSALDQKTHLANAAQVPVGEVEDIRDYLASLGLLDRDQFNRSISGRSLDFLLTRRGRAFVEFALATT